MEDRGFLSVLYDHFIDLDILVDDTNPGPNSESSPEDIEDKEAERVLPVASQSRLEDR